MCCGTLGKPKTLFIMKWKSFMLMFLCATFFVPSLLAQPDTIVLPTCKSKNILAGTLLITGALIADDVTVIGVADDVAIPVVVVGGVAYAGYEYLKYYITNQRIAKRDMAIDRTRTRTYNHEYCEQYALLATRNGWYPCLRCNGRDSIYLFVNEVWKYGKTVMGVKRSTFLFDKKGNVIKEWRNVKAGGHAEKVLAYVQENL